jgi:hypothetical protein
VEGYRGVGESGVEGGKGREGGRREGEGEGEGWGWDLSVGLGCEKALRSSFPSALLFPQLCLLVSNSTSPSLSSRFIPVNDVRMGQDMSYQA